MHPIPLRWLGWIPLVFGLAVILRGSEWRPGTPDAVEPWAADELRRNRAIARRFPAAPVPPLPKMLC